MSQSRSDGSLRSERVTPYVRGGILGSSVEPMRTVLVAALMLNLVPNLTHAAPKNRNLELAAIKNVAENIGNINWRQGPGGVVHHVMLAAAEMNISVERAAHLADLRGKDVMYSVMTKNRKAQFCRNAKAGKF